MDLRAHGKHSIHITALYLLVKNLLLCFYIFVSKLWPQYQNYEAESLYHTVIQLMQLILLIFFPHPQVTPK